MKKLFILILVISSLDAFSQVPGFTYFRRKDEYIGIIGDSVTNVAFRDTLVAPEKLGVTRLRLTGADSTVYICLDTTTGHKRWFPLKGATPTGAGLGSVTSINLIASGALGATGGPITSSGNITLGWQGTASDVVFGDGSYSNLNNAIGTYSDARYSPLGHTHTFSQITDGATAVGALFNAGTGLSYNPTTRTYSATGPVSQDGLQSGGVVTWSGTGLVFDITAASYVLGGSPYTSPVSQVTLDPADGSYGRWDAIIVTNSGTVSKITGTPAASPVLPQSDPASQIILTYVFVDAGATTPTQVSNEVIYDENIEWTHSTSGSVTANFASTTYAEQGTKSISTTWTSASNLIFTNGSVLSAGNYTTISFYVRLSGNLPNNTNISVQFYNSTNAVSNSVTSSISKSTTGTWQLVSFNISQFSFTSTSFNSVRLILTGSTVGTLGTTTVYFDNIRLQAGITPPTTVQGLQSAYSKFTDGSVIAAATGSDQIRFRSADNKLSIAVANNDATYGDNVLFTINQGNLSLSSIGGSLNVSQINATGGATGKVLSYDGTWVTNGGATPNLQAVTDAGSTTTNLVQSSGGFKTDQGIIGFDVVNGSGSSRASLHSFSDNGYLYLGNATGYGATIKADNVTGFYTYQLSNQAGTILVGATPTSSTDNTVTHKIKVNIGGTDYYIMATTSSL